jgi:hypothetical protein
MLKNFTFKQPNIVQLILLFLYKFTLDFVYVYFVSPRYSYACMTYHPYLYKYIVSLIFFVSLSLVAVKIIRINNASSFVLLILNLIYFIPTSTLYALAGLPDLYFLYVCMFWFFLHFFVLSFKDYRISKFNENSSLKLIIATVSLIVIVGIIYISGIYNNFRFHFGLMDVYKIRFAKRDLILPLWVAYFQPISATLSPVLMIYFFIRRKYALFAVFILIQLLMFGFGANKTTFFTLLISIFVCFLTMDFAKRVIILFFGILNIGVFVEILLTKISFIGYFFQYRICFLPSLLSYQFFDYFHKNKLLYLRESFLRFFGFSTGNKLETPFLISKVYYGKEIMSSNNGLCGDAYSNFGWISLFIYPLLLAFLLKLFDSVSYNHDHRIIIVISMILSLGLTNNTLFGLLLTNGFMFLIILLFLLPATT